MSLQCPAATESPGHSSRDCTAGRQQRRSGYFAGDFCREFVFLVAFDLFWLADILRASSRPGVSHAPWALREPWLVWSLSLCDCIIIYNSNNYSDSNNKNIFKILSKKVHMLLYSKACIDYRHSRFDGSWLPVQCTVTCPYKQHHKLMVSFMLWGMWKHSWVTMLPLAAAVQ